MSRRGCPIEITSDNGTNFRGATNELANEIAQIDQNHLREEFANFKWTFIPPRSPHMGGIWERMIRTVKSNIAEVIPTNRKPNDELLLTALLEIECVVNSRPLTELPINDDEEALTPNHFLIGTSGGVKPFDEYNDEKAILMKNWKKSEQISNHFWRRWVREYLPTLTRRTKWFDKVKPIGIGDVVIIIDEDMPRNTWKKGVVVDVNIGANNQVRSAVVRTNSGIYTRPSVKIAVLDVGISSFPTTSTTYRGTVTDSGI